MRKLTILCLSGLLLFGISCQKSENSTITTDQVTIDHRTCASNDVLQAQLAADPSLEQKMNDIENFTKRVIASREYLRLSTTGTLNIPVIVHVLYNTNRENISDGQIQSQIDVLNADYNLLNKDNTNVPALFSSLKAAVGVNFVLDRTIRKYTSVKSWVPNDAVKLSSYGGDDAIDPEHYLNIWVCNLTSDLLGYSSFPGGPRWRDGVVIGYFCFGTKGGNLIHEYNLGRTATHEIGHWMNLHHIWGDISCGNDFVKDTPQATGPNYGCPSYPLWNDCQSHEIMMTMNYMDYTNDACMYMFTNDQKDRMLAIFVKGGPRSTFVK
ncbi:MAG: zinc metalloprotease [Candidatus Dadabacteria bacterium]